MKEISLTNGGVALVDDVDYDFLSKYRWRASKTGRNPHNTYTITDMQIDGRAPNYMHRVILGVKDKRIPVDHKDRNGLNNTRENIRIATPLQNCVNKRKQMKPVTSKYKGVHKTKISRKWIASIRKDGKLHNLGSYCDEIEAALAYDKAAQEMFGEFAGLNFPNGAPDYVPVKFDRKKKPSPLADTLKEMLIERGLDRVTYLDQGLLLECHERYSGKPAKKPVWKTAKLVLDACAKSDDFEIGSLRGIVINGKKANGRYAKLKNE